MKLASVRKVLPHPQAQSTRGGPILAGGLSLLLHALFVVGAVRGVSTAPLRGASDAAEAAPPLPIDVLDDAPGEGLAAAPALPPPPSADEPASEAQNSLNSARAAPASPQRSVATGRAAAEKASPKPAPPAPVRQRPHPAPVARPEAEGEDWLGLGAQQEPKPEASADATSNAAERPSQHDDLIARLMAAEQRKAEARASAARAASAAPTPIPREPATQPSSAAARAGQSAQPASATARRIASARNLAQAVAWTIPYACATDPVWEQPASGSGQLELELQIERGNLVSGRSAGELPGHLKRLADGVVFYMKQGYRALPDLASDGLHTVRVTIRTSAGPKNQSLGFDADRARSHFTLVTGRRVDAEVAEPPAQH